MFLAQLAAFILTAGCANPTIEPTAQAPAEFSLTLYSWTSTNSITYFEMTRSGELRFEGGLDASTRQGKPVTQLTPVQRQEIWDILIQGKLHEAEAGPLFPKAKKVNYDFAFNTGKLDHIVRAADDEQPALKTLHDYLFQIQAKVRFGNQTITP